MRISFFYFRGWSLADSSIAWTIWLRINHVSYITKRTKNHRASISISYYVLLFGHKLTTDRVEIGSNVMYNGSSMALLCGTNWQLIRILPEKKCVHCRLSFLKAHIFHFILQQVYWLDTEMEWSKEKIFRFMYQIDTEDEENIYFFFFG